jgi:hypothetical protein
VVKCVIKKKDIISFWTAKRRGEIRFFDNKYLYIHPWYLILPHILWQAGGRTEQQAGEAGGAAGGEGRGGAKAQAQHE